MFPVDARPHEFDDGDVMARLLRTRTPWLSMNPNDALSIAS